MKTTFRDLSLGLKILVVFGVIQLCWNALVLVSYIILYFTGNL